MADDARPDIEWFDDEIDAVDRWIPKATRCLVPFYQPEGYFLRTDAQEPVEDPFESEGSIHPTTTVRVFEALAEYLRYREEYGERIDGATDVPPLYSDDKSDDDAVAISEMLETVGGTICRRFEDFRSTSFAGDDEPGAGDSSALLEKPNDFTDSHLLQAASYALRIDAASEGTDGVSKVSLDVEDCRNELHESMRTVVEGFDLPNVQGLSALSKDPVHDFVTLHALRGVDMVRMTLPDAGVAGGMEELSEAVRNRCLNSLAYETAGITGRFDPNELCFSLSLLNRLDSLDAPRITESGIRSITNAQMSDGGWPTPRYVSYEGRIHVASYEVALTMAELLHRLLYPSRGISLEEVGSEVVVNLVECLSETFSLVRKRFAEGASAPGWANDHARRSSDGSGRSGVVESWVTGIVVLFLVRYRDALVRYRQKVVLSRYDAETSLARSPDADWPHLLPWFRDERYYSEFDKDKDAIDYISDPTDEGRFRSAVETELVDPVVDDWLRRPQQSSFILYGEPGTRKTTATRMVAKAVGWPFIALTPSDFLRRRGLEGFEESAAEIFDDLSRLQKVVVLFDECEDFFMARPEESEIESRTVGAFITAGMLPKIERLHEQESIVFALATNKSIEDLDDAAIRKGRFDFKYNLSYPSLEAQRDYVEQLVEKVSKYSDVDVAAVEKTLEECNEKLPDWVEALEESDEQRPDHEEHEKQRPDWVDEWEGPPAREEVAFSDIHELLDDHWLPDDGLDPDVAAERLGRIVVRKGPPTLTE